MWYGASVSTRSMTEDFSQTLVRNAELLRNDVKNSPEKTTVLSSSKSKVRCLWHKRNGVGHVGRFGLMGECLDCMKQVESGYCSVDVRNFEFSEHWPIKSFWDKVIIGDPDDCWPWVGATRKNGAETAAYMPSPFHSGKIQSAARVAFWTSRGYSGKMRVFHRNGCDSLCCNPLHLRLREMEALPTPKKLVTVNLSYGNIFDQARTDAEKSFVQT